MHQSDKNKRLDSIKMHRGGGIFNLYIKFRNDKNYCAITLNFCIGPEKTS